MAVRGVALTGMLGLLLSGCGSDSPDAAATCASDALNVPSPVVRAGDAEQPMDLVFVRGCGTEADGAAGIGADPVLVAPADEIEVAGPDGYDISFTLSPVDSPGRDLDGADSPFVVAVPKDGCHLLTVDLDGGAVEARYAARVASTEGACTAGT